MPSNSDTRGAANSTIKNPETIAALTKMSCTLRIRKTSNNPATHTVNVMDRRREAGEDGEDPDKFTNTIATFGNWAATAPYPATVHRKNGRVNTRLWKSR